MADPDSLRKRAQGCRELSEEETDPILERLLHKLAAAYDLAADVKEATADDLVTRRPLRR
jgi:hypothetical protein